MPFPRLHSWLAGLKLTIAAFISFAMPISFEFWRFCMFTVIIVLESLRSGKFEPEVPLILVAICALLLFLCIACFMTLIGLIHLILRVLWSTPPKWIALPSLKTLLLRDVIVMLLSMLPCAVFYMLKSLLFASLDLNFERFQSPEITYNEFVVAGIPFWLIFSSFMYEIRFRKASRSA